MEKTKIKRYPRPYGLTTQTLHLQKTRREKGRKDPTYQEERNGIRDYVIDEWIRNNMRLNQKYLPMERLAQLLHMKVDELQERINERIVKRAGLWADDKSIRDWARVLGTRLIFLGSEIQAQVAHQAELLVRAQGGKYKAFISSAANQALKNLIDTQKPMLDALKHLTDRMPNLLNPAADLNPGNPTTYLSPEGAIDLILKNGYTLMTNPDALKLKAQELKGLPEVDARFQNLTNIGIRHDGTQKDESEVVEFTEMGTLNNAQTGTISITPDGKKSHAKSHTERREADGPILGTQLP